MKVIDTLTQEDFDGAFEKLLERYNKGIAAEGDYLEGDLSFMCVLSIKVPIRKKVWKLIICISYILFVAIYIYIYIYTFKQVLLKTMEHCLLFFQVSLLFFLCWI